MNLTGKMNDENDRLTETIIQLMRGDKSFDAPAESIKWAKNIFRVRAAAPEKSFIRKILAVLQVDLSGTQPAFGERSASVLSARQMFFEAGENSVDLRISQTKKGFSVRGQILGAGFENCTIKIGEFSARANHLSEFKFGEIGGGKYTMILQANDKEIVIENLELQ